MVFGLLCSCQALSSYILSCQQDIELFLQQELGAYHHPCKAPMQPHPPPLVEPSSRKHECKPLTSEPDTLAPDSKNHTPQAANTQQTSASSLSVCLSFQDKLGLKCCPHGWCWANSIHGTIHICTWASDSQIAPGQAAAPTVDSKNLEKEHRKGKPA